MHERRARELQRLLAQEARLARRTEVREARLAQRTEAQEARLARRMQKWDALQLLEDAKEHLKMHNRLEPEMRDALLELPASLPKALRELKQQLLAQAAQLHIVENATRVAGNTYSMQNPPGWKGVRAVLDPDSPYEDWPADVWRGTF